MEKNIKIIIADDHDLFIQGIQSLLKSETNVDTIEKAKNGKELLDILKYTNRI